MSAAQTDRDRERERDRECDRASRVYLQSHAPSVRLTTDADTGLYRQTHTDTDTYTEKHQ